MVSSATLRLMLCSFLIMRILVSGNPTAHLSLKEDVIRVSSALQHINREFLQSRTNIVSITLLSSCSASNDFFDELVNQFLRQSTNLKVTIQTVEVQMSFEQYNMLWVDSFDAVLQIDPGSMSKYQDFNEYYIIVLRNNDSTFVEEQQKIFDYFLQNYIVNVNILRQNDDQEVELYTFYPFTENHCNTAMPVLLNPKISVDLLKANQIFPKKLRDLHKCRLTVALWDVPPYLILPEHLEKNVHIRGIEGRLLHTIAEAMNFTLGYVVPPNNEQRGTVLPNGTLTGALRLLTNKEADLSMGQFHYTWQRSQIGTASTSFYQTRMVFAVMATWSPWTSYEILVYPFDIILWAILICILTTLSLLAALLKCKKPKVLRFLFNLPKRTAIPMYLIAALLGASTHQVPRRNFARFLWILFQWLTLLLRCAYQCLMFRCLSNQKTIAPPDKIIQLVQQGYKLVAHETMGSVIFNYSILPRGKVETILFSNSNRTHGIHTLEENPLENYVLATAMDFLTYYINSHGKHGLLHVLREKIFSQQMVIYFTKHSYLVSAVDRILLNLQSCGMVEHWASHYLDGLTKKNEHINEEPLQKAFTMTQLYAAFQILYCAWFLAFLVFMLELLCFRIRSVKDMRKIYPAK